MADRFWAKVDKGDGCWTWTAGTDRRGYGKLWDGERIEVASRMAWRLVYGSVPAGRYVLHRCDNPPCVKVTGDPAKDHLYLGDHRRNMADMVERGHQGAKLHPERMPRGARHGWHTKPESRPRRERHGHARLTDAKVAEMRQRRDAGARIEDLMTSYGVGRTTVYNVLTHRTWADGPVIKERYHHELHPHGETHHAAKLTAAQVADIRTRFAAGGVTQTALGREHGVSQTAISRIVRGEGWRVLIGLEGA